jgi:precorrin-6B methylase 1
VAAVASIDLKADEPGLLELARWQGWTIRFYPAAELATVPVPHPSETVRKYTGTPSVSEAAALLAAGAGMDQLIVENSNTAAPTAATPPFPSQGFPNERHLPSAAGGRIMLVGLGPGSHEHLTARARAAIAEADTVIGYVTYIRLVAELLEGKEVIKKSMTEELDRAIEAFERARQGRKVALISSGDAGVYGMAGPTFEVLFQAGWTPESGIEVEIIPGASALNTCAALVGAPLTHDFCAISLSDLLTPGRPSPGGSTRWPPPTSWSPSTTRRAAAAPGRSSRPAGSSCATAGPTRRWPSSSRPTGPSSASNSPPSRR